MREGKSYLGCEELCLVLREHSDLDQMAEKLTTFDKLHKEIDTELVLENIFHIH